MSKTLASLILSIGIAVACVVVFSQNVLIGLFVLLTILLVAGMQADSVYVMWIRGKLPHGIVMGPGLHFDRISS